MDTIKEWILDHKAVAIIGAVVLLLLVVGIGVFIGRGTFSNKDTVLGVDVSAYQGEINWKKLAKQNIDFAYVKATEDTDHLDSQFEDNWKNARKAGLKVGAYLFVNFNEKGKDQADYFIKNVPNEKDSLPPVIDLELYGDYLDQPMAKDKVVAMLKEMVAALEGEYDKTPIIYTNYNTYNTYLADSLKEIPIWICDISSSQPDLEGGHQWVFWQYSQRQILEGYDGDELFIDMNKFNGDLKEFKAMFQ